MSLLNSLIGALGGGGGGGNAAGQQGGLAQLAEIAAKNPQLMQVAAAMLSGGNKHGGLQGLLGAFQSAGMGDAAQSWVSDGANQPVSGDQVVQAFGPDAMARIAGKAGVPAAQAPGLLAQILPALVDQMTPKGQMPAQTPANGDAVLQLLGGLLGKR